MKKLFSILLFLIPVICFGQTDYKIPLSPYAKFYSGDTAFYQLNDLTASGLCDFLIDEQEADPLHGVLTPTPSTTFTSGYSSRIAYPAVAVIDLGGIYKIDHEYIYDRFGTDSIKWQFGNPGPANWGPVHAHYENGAAWKGFTDTVTTRYIRVYYANSGNQKVRELILYGHLVADSLPRTPAGFSPDTSYQTMGDFMGVNLSSYTPPSIHDSLGNMYRHYVNLSYMDTAIYQHNINRINFVFDKYSVGSTRFNYYFPGDTGGRKGPLISYEAPDGSAAGMGDDPSLLAIGAHTLQATQGVNQYNLNTGATRAIDYSVHPNADSTDPSSYDRLARMAWMIGAVFGKNKYPKDSIQASVPINGASGLNSLRYIESGNENDGNWLTKTRWYSPQAWEAYNSAYYDGNDGSMGSRFGVKKADRTMTVVMGGDAYGQVNHDIDGGNKSGYYYRVRYMRALAYWAYYSRPDHRLPFDAWNFHDYAEGAAPGTAPSPEMYGVRKQYQAMVDSLQEICPYCQVWETEWGYSRNRRVSLAPPPVPGKDSAAVQADWIARTWFLASFTKGLKHLILFQIRNDPLNKDYDSAGVYQFNTTGLIDGYQSPATFYFNFYAYPAYYFQKTIYTVLKNYKPDSIVYDNYDSLYVYRYRSATNADSVAYVVWSGTQTDRTVDSLSMKTGDPGTVVNDIRLKYKWFFGDTARQTADANGQIPLVITETPQIILTTIGTNGGQLVPKRGSMPRARRRE